MRLRHRNQMWIGSRVPPAGTVTPPVDPCVANLANNQLWYWDCDSIPNTDDIAGRVMAATGGPTSVAGKIGNAWRMTGSPGPEMRTADAAPLRLVATDFTVRFWINPLAGSFSSPGFKYWVITKYSGFTGWGVLIDAADGTMQFVLGNGSTQFLIDGPMLLASQWSHVVIVYNLASTFFKFYLNAVPQAGLSNSQFVIGSNATALKVGTDLDVGGTNGFDGLFDEFGGWGFPFEQCEVTADYASGVGLTHPFT